jgi:hypothetical protein
MPSKIVIGKCPLCLADDVPLLKSHIIPKFLWKDSGVTGSGRSFTVWSESHPHLNRRSVQDGIKEYLLCRGCEERFGKLESYAKPMFFGLTSPIIQRASGHHVWTGLDYGKLKLFHMSVLWRMAVSSHPVYAFVEMAEEEQETLRKMLLVGDPGEVWQYGCLVTLLRYHNKPLLGIFSQPRSIMLRRDHCFRLVLAGMQWLMFDCSSAPKDAPVQTFLSHEGTWALFQGEAEDHKYLLREINDLKKRLRDTFQRDPFAFSESSRVTGPKNAMR